MEVSALPTNMTNGSHFQKESSAFSKASERGGTVNHLTSSVPLSAEAIENHGPGLKGNTLTLISFTALLTFLKPNLISYSNYSFVAHSIFDFAV